MNYSIVETVEDLEKLIDKVKKAQLEFATYSQEKVDKIFASAAIAANKMRIRSEERRVGKECYS